MSVVLPTNARGHFLLCTPVGMDPARACICDEIESAYREGERVGYKRGRVEAATDIEIQLVQRFDEFIVLAASHAALGRAYDES